MAYYNDDIKIDKVSADTKKYGPYMGDAFFSDSKACLMATELKKAGAKGKVSYRRTFIRPEFFNKIFIREIYPVEHGTITFEIPESLTSRYSPSGRHTPHQLPVSHVRHRRFYNKMQTRHQGDE